MSFACVRKDVRKPPPQSNERLATFDSGRGAASPTRTSSEVRNREANAFGTFLFAAIWRFQKLFIYLCFEIIFYVVYILNLKFVLFQKSLRDAGLRPPRLSAPSQLYNPGSPNELYSPCSVESEDQPQTLARAHDTSDLSPHIPNTPGEPDTPEECTPVEEDTDAPSDPDSPVLSSRTGRQQERQRRLSQRAEGGGAMSPRHRERRTQMSERRAQVVDHTSSEAPHVPSQSQPPMQMRQMIPGMQDSKQSHSDGQKRMQRDVGSIQSHSALSHSGVAMRQHQV